MPHVPRDHRFEIMPDWVCEILSPGTARKDRAIKMPLYARHGIAHLWLVDPLERTLEAYGLEQGRWVVLGVFKDDDIVSVAPFTEIALQLNALWPEEDR